MPNKCDYCPTPIDGKKHTWIDGRERTRGLLLDAPLAGEVTRQGPSVLGARIHPLIEHAGAGTPPHGLRLGHTGANDQAQGRSTTTSMSRALVAGRLKKGSLPGR